MSTRTTTEADTGAVTLIQRFGSAANLNIHLHCLVLDAVYQCTGGGPLFHEVRAPTSEQLQDLLQRIITRIMKWLTRQGYLIEEKGMSYLSEIAADRAFTPLQAASCIPSGQFCSGGDSRAHLSLLRP